MDKVEPTTIRLIKVSHGDDEMADDLFQLDSDQGGLTLEMHIYDTSSVEEKRVQKLRQALHELKQLLGFNF